MIYVPFTGPAPTQKRDGDAGWDIAVTEGAELRPGIAVRLPTNLHLELPYGYCALGLPRSSSIMVTLHVAGLIDSNFRGEVGVLCTNIGLEPLRVEAGERIAQLLILPVVPARFIRTDELRPSNRGDAWNGSSGK
jgi:dUTP pyrophosphatase